MDSTQNDTYLADWLAGKLSDQELIELIGQEEFEAFAQLRADLPKFQPAQPDMDRSYAALKEKIEALPNARRTQFHLPIYAAVAAVVVLLFGIFGVVLQLDKTSTPIGATSTITLDDGSKIVLNSNSKAKFPKLFSLNRSVDLEGEAYFEVAKGREFRVNTESGLVKVLGTKFNVSARASYFSVDCYHGEVLVTSRDVSKILVAGESVRFYNGKPELLTVQQGAVPGWINGESEFKNAPLEKVILDLKSRYRYIVIYPTEFESVRFTGNFPHNDIDLALRSVCIPLGLKYTVDKERITITR